VSALRGESYSFVPSSFFAYIRIFRLLHWRPPSPWFGVAGSHLSLSLSRARARSIVLILISLQPTSSLKRSAVA
jgi:hypothetical protein